MDVIRCTWTTSVPLGIAALHGTLHKPQTLEAAEEQANVIAKMLVLAIIFVCINLLGFQGVAATLAVPTLFGLAFGLACEFIHAYYNRETANQKYKKMVLKNMKRE